MALEKLSDQQLHSNLQRLIGDERLVMTKILHHLREVERRKLFCDFGCSSLFDYAVNRLGYSEGQAHRRIQAMRLMRELPQLKKKIAAGTLNLSNISQAQTLNEKQNQQASMNKLEKLEVLKQLENKSTREGQKMLLKLRPEAAMPKDKERQVTENHVEVRFIIDDKLKAKLEDVRSLLGSKGVDLSYAELLDCMADLSLAGLNAKKFGARRTSAAGKKEGVRPNARPVLLASQVAAQKTKQERYIPQKTKHEVWLSDRGRCQQCGSNQRLNYDHIVPVAKNGRTEVNNLRLLCFHCNQRAAIQAFGVAFMLDCSSKNSRE